jgi:hypothetical protein
MKFTNDKLKEIQKAYDKIQKEDKTYKYGLGVTIAPSDDNGTGVMLNTNEFVFVEVEDLKQLIYELQNMKKAIEETTGLIL